MNRLAAIYSIWLSCLLYNCTSLEITCERANVVRFNEELYSKAEALCFPYNRTLRMLNMTFAFARSPGVNDAMNLKLHIFLSNRYVLTGVQTTIKWKALVNYPHFGIKRFLARNTMPSFNTWPIPVGEYKMFNIILDGREIPFNIALGHYMAEIEHVDEKKREMMLWHYHLKIN